MKKYFLLCSVVCAGMLLTACSDYVGKEKTHPLFVKAGTSKTAGEYKEAAKCYEEFLMVCPKSAKAHLELASVYSDYLDDPFQAYYHYQKVLDLDPSENAETENIRSFMNVSKKRMLEKLKQELKDPATDGKIQELETELAKTRQALDAQTAYSKKAYERYMSLRNRQTVQKKTAAAPAKSNAGHAAPAKSSSAAGGVQVYTVQKGDTLQSLSRKFYGSSTYTSLIANANKLDTRKPLQLGRKLRIPPMPAKKNKDI